MAKELSKMMFNENEMIEVKNECQMWKEAKRIFKENPDTEIFVYDAEGNLWKDLWLKSWKGKKVMSNKVIEHNRMRLKKAASTAAQPEVPAPVAEVKAEVAENISDEAKIAARKAKKAAYDKARRERLKAQKAAALAQA